MVSVRRAFAAAVLAFAVASAPADAAHKPRHRPPPPPPAATVLLDERFDGPAGTAPDPARWVRYDYCDKWGALTCNLGSNAVLDGQGNLALTARHAPGHIDRFGNAGFNWTGARVESGKRWYNTALFSFFHGTASAWIRMPRAVGSWAAFWMLNLKDALGRYGEVDVVEALGRETQTGGWHATLHSWTGTTHNGSRGSRCDAGLDLTADFHRYSVTWQVGRVDISLDDRPCLSVTSSQLAPWNFDRHPAILLFSLDVGGSWAGAPILADYPATMLVSQVTVTG